MAYRRRRQQFIPDHSDGSAPNNVDQLAFKYMEMCKVESSTDSESEISPRWSDTSPMDCPSSAPESSGQALPLVHEHAGRNGCYSLFLDPYDGSSEDSDEFNMAAVVSGRRTRQQGKGGEGGCRVSRRNRRLIPHHPPSIALRERVKDGGPDLVTQQQHLLDVQMKCGSDSELCPCDLVSLPSVTDRDGCRDLVDEMTHDSTIPSQPLDIELHCQLDSAMPAAISSTSPTIALHLAPVEPSSSQMLDCSLERSPSPWNLPFHHKRKLGVPGADTMEMGHRKRQCVVNIEEEPDGGDSASEAC